MNRRTPAVLTGEYRHIRFCLRSGRHIPLVATLEALPEIAARLGELHLGAHVTAFRTGLGHGLVPRDEVAGLVAARVERGAALLRAALHQLAAVLRAEHTRGHGARASALREGAAAQELAAASLPHDHRLTAEMTGDVRHLRLRLLALERSRVG